MLMMITNEIVKDKDDKIIIIIREGIDFIFSHFKEPLFPRTISTFATNNAQITVYDKQGIFEYFKAANYLDCRINAYPAHTDYKGINRQPANFLFIDLDLKDFKSKDALDKAKNNTLRKIEKVLGEDFKPTVLWTGNGYHIYEALEGFILEEYDIFSEFADSWKKQKNKDLTTVFMHFAERFFTDNRNDGNHTPTVKSCMLRVPYTFNSKKCLSNSTNSEVKLVQKWNGQMPAINYLLRDFRHYLINEKLILLFRNFIYETYSSIYMSKKDLINTIGRIFVDEQFRTEYFNNTDQTVDSITELTDTEKQFLKSEKNKIRPYVEQLNVRYEGENKRS
jgi:hypothetical protein